MPKWKVIYCRLAAPLLAVICAVATSVEMAGRNIHAAAVIVRIGFIIVVPTAIANMIYVTAFYRKVQKYWIKERSVVTVSASSGFETDTGRKYKGGPFERELNKHYPASSEVIFFVNPK